MKNYNNKKWIGIGLQDLPDLLNGKIKLDQPLPADSEVLAVKDGYKNGIAEFLVSSASFREVPVGECIPCECVLLIKPEIGE